MAAQLVNVVNPGLVNVADEAYPIVPPDFQDLVFDSKRLLSASLFAPNPPPIGPQFALPVPAFVPVADQAYARPLFSLLSFPPPPEINVNAQNLLRVNTGDFIVTDAGNFQTNASSTDLATLVVLASVINPNGGNPTITIFFAPGTNLFDFGLNLAGREADFPNQIANGQVPASTVLFYSTNFIIVVKGDLTAPIANDIVEIDVSREGSEAVFQFFDTPTLNVFVQSSTPPAISPPVAAQVGFFQGNFFPSTQSLPVPLPAAQDTGVRSGFFEGEFEIINQFIGQGLPENFFP